MEKYIKTLELELKIKEIHRFIKEHNNNLAEIDIKNINKIKFELIPLVTSILIMAKKRNALTVSLCVLETVVIFLVNSILDVKDKVGVIRSDFGPKFDQVYSYILDKADKVSHTKYFKQEYLNYLSENEEESEDERKFNEAYEKQISKEQKEYKKNHPYLTKRETMEEIVSEIDFYYDIYELPLLDINDKDWDNIFDTLYNYLKDNNIEKNFYDIASSLVRYTLASKLGKKEQPIMMQDFIDNISNLAYNYLDFETTINLKNEVIDNLTKAPVLSLNKYKEKKLKKY